MHAHCILIAIGCLVVGYLVGQIVSIANTPEPQRESDDHEDQ